MSIFAERKILSHLDELSQYVNGGFYAPIQVEIDLTNKCTSDCPWCFGYVDRKWTDFTLLSPVTDDIEERNRVSSEKIKRLIDDFSFVGVKSITFTGGGDPTCHTGLFTFIEYAHEKGIEIGLITNGVIPVIRALPYCKWIRFSVDAATKETYGFMHGKPHHFEKVIENVKTASIEKMKHGYPCTLGVGFLTGEKTSGEIKLFTELWKDCSGLDYIQFRPLLDAYGSSWFTKNPTILDEIRDAVKIDSRVVCSTAKYNALMAGESGQTENCHGIFFESAIAADGKVYTCCHQKGMEQFAVGNLHTESFISIWQRHLRNRKYKVNKYCPSFCRHYGTNKFIEDEVLNKREHVNFI